MTDNRIACNCEANVHPKNATRRTEDFTKCTCVITDPSKKTRNVIKVQKINIKSSEIKNN